MRGSTVNDSIELATDWVKSMMPPGFLDGEYMQQLRDTEIPYHLAEALRQVTKASQFVRGSVGAAAWMCASSSQGLASIEGRPQAP